MIGLALLTRRAAAVTGVRRIIAPAPDLELLAADEDEIGLARRLGGLRPDVLVVDRGWESAAALALCRRVKARPASPT